MNLSKEEMKVITLWLDKCRTGDKSCRRCLERLVCRDIRGKLEEELNEDEQRKDLAT